MQEIKKIVVIGPESTGKSTICTLLAQHYNTIWCPEYAREYLLEYGTNYTFETLEEIGKGQLRLEDEYTLKVRSEKSAVSNQKSAVRDHPSTVNLQPLTINNQPVTSNLQQSTSNHQPLLFIDTDMHVMKVWCEYVFAKCHQFILDEIVARKYDLYLLCNTDIAWVKDELREYPDERIRQELFQIYKDILINQSTPWVELKGDYDARLQTAIEAVNTFCL